MLKTPLTILTAALLTTAAHGQSVIGQAPKPSHIISYADLDLTQPAGIAALDRRIAVAMTRVCGRKASGLPLVEHAKRVQCRREVMASVETKRHAVIADAQRRDRQSD